MGRKPKQPREAYGAWLQHLRTESGLSQDEFSELTGIPQSTITLWENSGKLVGRDQIIRLAKALNVSVSKLLRVEKAE